MFYLVQENTFREENYDALVDAISRLSLGYEIVKVLPFVEDIDFDVKESNVFCFGSVKMARVARKYGWRPGSLLNSNHDYTVYSKFYGDNLLNFDSVVQPFSEDVHLEEFFARPCEDTKVFTGKVFDQRTWKLFKEDVRKSNYVTSLSSETLVQICSVKHPTKEFRFWVVDGKVVTGSLYRSGYWVNYSPIVDTGAVEFCQSMVKLYQLADAFVMDVCEVIDKDVAQYKVVECGCINSAGFYKADMQKLIVALENKFNE